MEDTIAIMSERNAINEIKGTRGIFPADSRSVKKKRIPSRYTLEAVESDGASLVSRGEFFSLKDVRDAQRLLRRIRIAKERGDDSEYIKIRSQLRDLDSTSRSIAEDIG